MTKENQTSKIKHQTSTIPTADGHGPARTDTDEALPSRTAAQATSGCLEIEMWAVGDLEPHPDNPRSLNVKSAKFLDLVESIRRNGVLEALTVRIAGGGLQVLSGHRRLAAAIAAGLDQVPIRNLGQITDDLAYDIVAMANLHEDLTPLEEGKRAAVWLDKYHQDAKAVASKLGKSEHWVLTHAMIDRNLIPAWKKAIEQDAQEAADDGDYGRFSRWTAAHWVQIARLPAAIQEQWLPRICKGYPYNPRDATADTVAEWLAGEKLLLGKAPFDTAKACKDCPKRTDAISQTLWADPDVKTEDAAAVRCLDSKCWQRQAAKAVRQDFLVKKDTAAVSHNIVGDKARDSIVPISMIAEPQRERWDDPAGWKRYQAATKPIKAAFRKDLVTVDRITEVKPGTKGAVLGIVVAGRGKGSAKWVKLAKKPEARREPWQSKPKTAAQIAQEKEAKVKEDRWKKVILAIRREVLKMPRPDDRVVLLCAVRSGQLVALEHDLDKDERKIWDRMVKAHEDVDLSRMVGAWVELCWQEFRQRLKETYVYVDRQVPIWKDLGPLFGINLEQWYNNLAAQEEEKPKSESSDLKSQTGKAGENHTSTIKHQKSERSEHVDPVDVVDDQEAEGGPDDDDFGQGDAGGGQDR